MPDPVNPVPDLLPCPFCGGEANWVAGFYGTDDNLEKLFWQTKYPTDCDYREAGCMKCNVTADPSVWNKRIK